MQSSTKTLRPRERVVDYSLNGNHNATPLWLKTKTANPGVWANDAQASTKPQVQQRKGAPGKENEVMSAPDNHAQSHEAADAEPDSDQAPRGKRKLNQKAGKPANKPTKRPKQSHKQQPVQQERSAPKPVPAAEQGQAQAAAVAAELQEPGHAAAEGCIGARDPEPPQRQSTRVVPPAAEEPAAPAAPVPHSIEEVLQNLRDDGDVNEQLLSILQRVLQDYHSLKDTTIMNTEAIISEQARRYEKALEAKQKLASRWQEQAKRNEQFLSVNCVQDFKEQIAQLEVSLAEARVQQQEAVVLNEQLAEQLKMQAVTVDHLREQLENRGRRVEAAERLVQELQAAAEPQDLMLKSAQAAAQELQQKLALVEAEAAQLRQRLLHPAKPRCRNVATMARPTAKAVEVQTETDPSSTAATASVAVGPDEPMLPPHTADTSIQCPTPAAPSPGIGIQCPTPPSSINPRSPLHLAAGLTMDQWQAIWYKSQAAQQPPAAEPAPVPSPADMDIDEDDDSPVRGLTNGSPLKPPVSLEHTPACLCPEGIQPPSSERLPFAPAPSPPTAAPSLATPQATLHCSPLASPPPATLTPAAAAAPRRILGLPPAAGQRFAGRSPASPAEAPARQQPSRSAPACFAPTPVAPGQPRLALECDRESACTPAASAPLPPALLQAAAAALPVVPVPAAGQPLLHPLAAGALPLPSSSGAVEQGLHAPEFSFPTPTGNHNRSLHGGLQPSNSNNSSVLAVDGRPITQLSGVIVLHDNTTNNTIYTDTLSGFQFRIGPPTACSDSGPATPSTPGGVPGAWQRFDDPLMYEVVLLGKIPSGAVGPAGTDTFAFPGAQLHWVMETVFRTLKSAQMNLIDGL